MAEDANRGDSTSADPNAAGSDAAGTDAAGTDAAARRGTAEYVPESRWLSWKAAALRRLAGGVRDEEPAEPFRSGRDFRRWSADAAAALLDVQFHRQATRTLLPLAYILGLIFACAVPIALTVLLWQVSIVLGVLAALVAIPLGLTIAAAVRLMLEFLVNASRLATRVEHISDLADDLFQALSDVAEPVNQLSEDVRAVQFWRFRGRNPRK
ncbi:DUF4282 domain-containing protein [Nocardia farcinica]|uniref:DUF4282 domain-containing protein n=1 Tax=Nocardia farcinica TaxID=37329 RepID=UPI001B3C930C|nr:DUF4282 domain-containing protein [Nocardia farcinica]MBF6537146.1 DUF4282 domain-containing protein [Nocardia farcinica]